MSPDQRMLWIRGVEALRAAEAVETLEVEFGSEVPIAGLLDYEDRAVLCSRITVEADSAGMYKNLLRLQSPCAPTAASSESSPQGYVFRDGPIGELLALISLFLEARFYLLSISHRTPRQPDLPIKREFRPLRGEFGPDLDEVIFSTTERNFAIGLGSFLNEIRSIPSEEHQAVAFATNHYARALRQIGVDEEMVFVRLVSAVETLLRTRRAKARFVSFLKEFSSGFFDCEPREPEVTQVTPETLGPVAAAVYDARSAYLHSGDPMYLSLRIRGRSGWHMDPFTGMTWQNREFKASQKLPRSDFFHRLVRHCLLSYIRNLGHDSRSARSR